MTFYTSIFRRAWTITKHHPVLWLFGLFTLFWSGKSLDLELFYTHVDLLGSVNSPFNPEFWNADRWNLLQDWLAVSSPTYVLMLAVLVVLFVFVLALIMIAQIGLVDAFGRSAKKHDVDVKYTVGDAFEASQKHLLSVTGVNVAGKLVAYALVAMASIPLFVGVMSSPSQVLLSWMLLLIGTPLAVALSIIVKFAVNHIVIEGEDAVVAVWKGWVMFKKNLGISIELAVVMILGFAGANVVALLSAAVIALPFAFAGNVLALWFGTSFGFDLMYFVFYIAGVLALTITSMIFSAWHHGCWTLLYNELKGGKKRSKTHRLWKGEKA